MYLIWYCIHSLHFLGIFVEFYSRVSALDFRLILHVLPATSGNIGSKRKQMATSLHTTMGGQL